MEWIRITGSTRAGDLEPAFQDALRGLAGSWTIQVNEGLVGDWWLLVIRRDDGFEKTLLISPREQSAGHIREAVQEAFRAVPSRRASHPQMLPPGLTHDRRVGPRY
jgi:hypothetical protein